MTFVRPFVAIILALLVTLTSQQMAVARGQAAVAGEMVLCTGLGSVVTVNVDADGQPTGPAHICPDCALSLMFAVADPALPTTALTLRAVTYVVRENTISYLHPAVAPLARGPPLPV
jgi:hypothetical protein